MRHFKKRVLALLLAGAVGIGNYASVSASAIKDAQDKKDEAQQELNQVNQQIQNIQSAQNSLQAEMNNYDISYNRDTIFLIRHCAENTDCRNRGVIC